MKMVTKDKSGASRDQSPSTKQDPLERRRLQNRLSQRNHREKFPQIDEAVFSDTDRKIGRKIRDRIAKLQERVIANELRAASGAYSWSQPYGSTNLSLPKINTKSTSFTEPEMWSQDRSPMSIAPPTPCLPHYMLPGSLSCFSNIATSQTSASSEPPYIAEISAFGSDSVGGLSPFSPTSSSLLSMSPISTPKIEHCQGPWTLPSSPSGSTPMRYGSNNQPMYYVATGCHAPFRLLSFFFCFRTCS